MPLFHLILVALIQGITEFLPVSSSGHLVLLPMLSGYEDQGLAIDIAAHVGTLFAVVLYFWSDVRLALGGFGRMLRGKIDTQGAWLALCLTIATVPVMVVGLIFKLTGLADALRSAEVIAWTMILFGVLLYVADQRASLTRTQAQLSLNDALKLGLWQAVALVPGTSRSGVTITGALMLGYTREDGARIAMLMSIPTIIASGILAGADAIGSDVALRDVSIVIGLSFVAALAALSLMMRLLKTVSFTPYVIYRLLVGVALLMLVYSGALS
ncbi:MAG: undecaprenyl-diphosphate phosphatase [Rhodobacteraceae bacterium]|nr:undecaprenyl-diphosphate phosphatase [Paracoccaceae bacterium]